MSFARALTNNHPHQIMTWFMIFQLIFVLSLLASVHAVPTDSMRFTQSVHWDDMGWTISLRFAEKSPDVFAGEKTGQIRWYPSIHENVYTVVTTLPTHDHDDRGLMGLAIHPDFPAKPFLYALHTLGNNSPQCPINPFVDPDSFSRCASQQRLVRIQVDVASRTLVGSPEVLLQGWCTVGTSHSVGDLKFTAEGHLLVTGGDGSVYQHGVDVGYVGDGCYQPGGRKLQGTFRVQYDEELHGKLILIEANQLILIGGIKPKYRIVAKGLRNPYRIGIQPETGDVFIGDVGASFSEEVNHVPNPVTHPSSVILNFGWPCLEGHTWSKDILMNKEYVTYCQMLALSGVVMPWFEYNHDLKGVRGDSRCQSASASPTGIIFYPSFASGIGFGPDYSGKMFMLEGSKRCIYTFEVDPVSRSLDPSSVNTFVFTPKENGIESGQFIDAQIGSDGTLYVVDIAGSAVHAIRAPLTMQHSNAVIH